MKIVVADDLPASALAVLRAEADWVVDARPGRSPDQLAAALADADALLVRSATRVDARLIDAAPALRVIARAGTGVDNVDVEAASRRGILVVNAPGANSVSVAEHAIAMMLALARSMPAADRAMKAARWEKRRFLGTELRGKTLAVVGFGRIGREVAQRARAFGMRLVAYDPFIPREIATAAGAELVSLDEACAAADFITLHLPSTPETHHLFDAARFARCRPGVRLVNTARGDLIDPAALARAIDDGIVAGAGLDVFEVEPPADWSLVARPELVATPHIAASTGEAQELVGLETATTVRDYLREGVVRNAVNFPAIRPDDLKRLRPWMRLAEALGTVLARHAGGRIAVVSVRYYGALADGDGTAVVANSAVAALLRPAVAGGASVVNARALARERGVEIAESRSSRPRDYTSLLSVRIRTESGEQTAEGTVFEPERLRLVSVNGVNVEAPLAGTLVLLANDDQPGVIGEVGSILGRRAINIASFALGRGAAGAVAAVNVDDPHDGTLERAVADLSRVAAVRDAWIVRLQP